MFPKKTYNICRYVPHANRALRSFNMYLNVRKPPLRSKFYWNPLSFFFPRPEESTTNSASSSTSRVRPRSPSTTRQIHTIPPANNPRGELIFSSRVDKSFRESYERYRATFERRRKEKVDEEKRKTWYGKIIYWRPWSTAIAPAPTSSGNQSTPTPSRTGSSASSSRGRMSRSGTPPTTPGIMMKQRDRSRSPRDRETDMRTTVLERSVNGIPDA